ncbi:hypothetical protein ACLOJK_002110 [Asimina triloba]
MALALKTNPSRTWKRVEAEMSSLKRAKDGNAFTRWYFFSHRFRIFVALFPCSNLFPCSFSFLCCKLIRRISHLHFHEEFSDRVLIFSRSFVDISIDFLEVISRGPDINSAINLALSSNGSFIVCSPTPSLVRELIFR